MQTIKSAARRRFNTTGACNPARHYMVDLTERLKEIRQLIDDGEYFTITRARQYGKTTTLRALAKYLQDDYIVLSLDFQMLGKADFDDEYSFTTSFSDYVLRIISGKKNSIQGLDDKILEKLEAIAHGEISATLSRLFTILSELCENAEKPVVLMIDEVDSASNNQVFLDLLAQLRGYYLNRDNIPTFQSVILAGLYDVKNVRRKIRPEEAHYEPKVHIRMCADDLTGTAQQFVSIPVEEHKINSPWNIAADFDVNMSLSESGICGMLQDYEGDHHTGMDTAFMAKLLYEYTSGYPFLVSRICKLIDEKVAGSDDYPQETEAWTKSGFLEAVKMMLMEKNTLFESLMGKLTEYPELKGVLYATLFGGEKIVYNPDNSAYDIAMMFGFVKNRRNTLVVANRVFEIRLYNYFLSITEHQYEPISRSASQDKNQFIKNDHLDMELLLTKFVEHFDQIYGDHAESFDEEEGRRRFLLYLRPIINGTGNYYIEAETRNARRMDVVVDYHGEQFIVELKIWRGNAYNERGEEQLSEYLDYFHLKKGYMLSYNFNQKKEVGVKKISVGDRTLIEAVV